MYRLLIIDDEYHVVDSLYELLATQTDMELELLKAYTGTDALHLLSLHRIDIVLLDIKMPGISGIDIYQKIQKDWPSCYTIFLTGNATFDHLYKISKDKNVSFLLKTESFSTILKTVKEVILDIEHKKQTQTLISKSERNEHFITYIVEREILHKIAQGYTRSYIDNWKSLYQVTTRIFLDQGFFLFGMRIYNAKDTHTLNALIDSTDFHLDIISGMENALDNKFNFFIYMSASPYVFIAAQEKADTASSISAELFLSESQDLIVHFLSEYIGSPIHVVFNRPKIQPHNLSLACKQLKDYMNNMLPEEPATESIGIMLNDCTKVPKNHTGKSLDNSIRELTDDIKYQLMQGTATDVLVSLEKLEHLFLSTNTKMLVLIAAYQNLTSVLLQFISINQLDKKADAGYDFRVLYRNDYNGDWKNVFDSLKKLVKDLIPLYKEVKKDNTNSLIHTIFNFIESHLDSELSLTMIANHVNYTNSYISHLFRQVVGLPVSAYVVNTKIEKAKELLGGTNQSIGEIAKSLGFDTAQYFSSVFKKKTGLSPKEFRNTEIFSEQS